MNLFDDFCACGHVYDQHFVGRLRCMARDSYNAPCRCTSPIPHDSGDDGTDDTDDTDEIPWDGPVPGRWAWDGQLLPE